MAAIERPYEQLGMRKLGARDRDDVIGGIGFVDADEDRLHFLRAGGAQHVEPGAVAVMHFEAEVAGGTNHVHVVVDDRYVEPALQERLAHDLRETAEADDEHAAFQVGGGVDAVHRRLRGADEALHDDHHERRQRHRQDHYGGEDRAQARIQHADGERGGEQHERELAALREHRGAPRAFAMRRAEYARDHIDAERLDEHERRNSGDDDAPFADDDRKIERHADAQEEQPQQQAAERLDVRLELMAKRGFGEQHAGEEGAHRHRQPAGLHDERGPEHHEQGSSRHDLARADAREQAEERIEQPLAGGYD